MHRRRRLDARSRGARRPWRAGRAAEGLGASGMDVVRFDGVCGDFLRQLFGKNLLAGAAARDFRGVSCTSWTEDDTRLACQL